MTVLTLTPPPIPVRDAPAPRTRLDVRIVDYLPDWYQSWSDLELRLGLKDLTCSATWTRTWLKHYGDLIPHRFLVARHQGQIVGMSLLTSGIEQYEGPFPIKTLHLGTAGEPEGDSVCVEFNRLLVAPEQRVEFAQRLVETVLPRERCDRFQVDGLAAEELTALTSQNAPTSIREVPSYYTDLDKFRNAPDEPLRLYGPSTRTNLRRSLRDLGDLQLDWSDSVDQALAFYEDLTIHHQSRWRAVGKLGVFASRRFRAFHQELIQELVPQKRAILVRARKGARVLGLLYLLVEQNRLLYYQSGYPDPDSKLSLGNVTLYLTMLEATRRGYDAFDFMAGDAQYKRVLSTDHHKLYWLQWRRPRLKFLLLDALRMLRGTK